MALVPDSSLLKHGAEVKDSMGEKLGTVSETAEGYFKINVHMARDYWLPIDVIANYAGDVVELRYPHDELGAYRQYSGIERLPEEELEGAMGLDEAGLAQERRYEAQSALLEETQN